MNERSSMAVTLSFAQEEMSVDEGLGYPRAYAKLCQNSHQLNPYRNGPPSTFIPHLLSKQQTLRVRELNGIFPVIDQERKRTGDTRSFRRQLWEQLDHLGNAGFNPQKFRVDAYGNVIYIHADSGSPLSWEISLWFPFSRGGLTVPSNLRILQWQVSRKMKSNLEFLVPWWDLQLGVSVNQFLSLFAFRNSDFGRRAFSFLFFDGENEKLSASQSVASHRFPQNFISATRHVGLAPPAIVSLKHDVDASLLESIDSDRPEVAAKRILDEEDEALSMKSLQYRLNESKENGKLDMNKIQSVTIAIERASLKHKRETQKKEAEKHRLNAGLNELMKTSEAEQIAIENMELVLLKYRKRAKKWKHLADKQSSYKLVLEKMIRDAMHRNVVYKEQIRLNQAAKRTLMAKLQEQRGIRDSAGEDIRRQLKQRDDIKNQIRPRGEKARKRSRLDHTPLQKQCERKIHNSPVINARRSCRLERKYWLDRLDLYSNEGSEQREEEDQDMHDNANGKGHADSQTFFIAKKEKQRNNELQSLATEDNGYNEKDFGRNTNLIPESPSVDEHFSTLLPHNMGKFRHGAGSCNMVEESVNRAVEVARSTHRSSKCSELGSERVRTNRKRWMFVRVEGDATSMPSSSVTSQFYITKSLFDDDEDVRPGSSDQPKPSSSQESIGEVESVL